MFLIISNNAYIAIQEAIANICLIQGNVSEATSHFKEAIQIYELIWENEPEWIEAKYQEQGTNY